MAKTKAHDFSLPDPNDTAGRVTDEDLAMEWPGIVAGIKRAQADGKIGHVWRWKNRSPMPDGFPDALAEKVRKVDGYSAQTMLDAGGLASVLISWQPTA